MFHVFVEGATDGSPAGLERLATAISAHYGIPAPDLLSRLSKGRFRVKGNIDRAAAETYVRDLTRLGARCTIEEAQPAQRLTPTPFPAIQPRPAAPPASPPQRAFSLSSVDGADDQSGAASAAAFAPPSETGVSASIGPPPEKARTEKVSKPKPKDEPLDMFAPPDAQEASLSVDIADDEKALTARKRVSTPPANVVVVAPPGDAMAQPPSRASTPAMRRSAPSIQPATVSVAAPGAKKGGLKNPDTRFVVGVVLAMALGFVPAHFISKMRESSAFEAIDRKVIGAQTLAETPEQYELLDKLRADQLAKKYSERRNAAILAILVWAAVAGGLAFVWFKKIDWDKLEA